MIVPELPFDLAADQIVANFEPFHIDGAGLRLLRSLRADILQRLSFFLEDDDPRWRVLVIRVLIQKLSLVFLID